MSGSVSQGDFDRHDHADESRLSQGERERLIPVPIQIESEGALLIIELRFADGQKISTSHR
jgi:hypothetical protein